MNDDDLSQRAAKELKLEPRVVAAAALPAETLAQTFARVDRVEKNRNRFIIGAGTPAFAGLLVLAALSLFNMTASPEHPAVDKLQRAEFLAACITIVGSGMIKRHANGIRIELKEEIETRAFNNLLDRQP